MDGPALTMETNEQLFPAVWSAVIEDVSFGGTNASRNGTKLAYAVQGVLYQVEADQSSTSCVVVEIQYHESDSTPVPLFNNHDWMEGDRTKEEKSVE